jgi:hypothetical protein
LEQEFHCHFFALFLRAPPPEAFTRCWSCGQRFSTVSWQSVLGHGLSGLFLLPLFSERKLRRLDTRPGHQLFHACDDFGMLRGDVASFAKVGREVVEFDGLVRRGAIRLPIALTQRLRGRGFSVAAGVWWASWEMRRLEWSLVLH